MSTEQHQQNDEGKTKNDQPQEPGLKGEGSTRIVERWVRDPAGFLRIERIPEWLPTEAEQAKALASLAKAWPVLAKHADYMDGEFDLALTDVRRMFAALRAEIAHVRQTLHVPPLVAATTGCGFATTEER